MGSAEEALRTLLTASAGVTNLVGARVYGPVGPNDPQYPLITMQRISTVPWDDLAGAAETVMARFQVSCYADDHSTAHNVAEQVRRVLDGRREPTAAVVKVVRWDNETMLHGGEPTDRYMIAQDYMVVHSVTAATPWATGFSAGFGA